MTTTATRRPRPAATTSTAPALPEELLAVLKRMRLPYIRNAAPELLAKLSLSDAEIEGLVTERTQAKKARNFARADAIRNELIAKGILIEDSKDGVRWRRK